MVLIPVKYIIQGIVSLQLIALDASNDLEIFLCVKKYAEIEQLPYFGKMQHKKAFYNNHWCRMKGQNLWFM